jgi:hypothetical protein
MLLLLLVQLFKIPFGIRAYASDKQIALGKAVVNEVVKQVEVFYKSRA